MPATRPARNEEGPWETYILKRHYEEHGYTEGCDACGRASAGMKSKGPHSSKCRKRMYDELGKTEEGRKWLSEAEDRIDEFMVERIRADHEGKDEGEAAAKASRSSSVPGAAGADGTNNPN